MLQLVSPIMYEEIIEDTYYVLVGEGYPVNPTNHHIVPHIAHIVDKAKGEIKDLILAEEIALAVERGEHEIEHMNKATFCQMAYQGELPGFSSEEHIRNITLMHVKDFLTIRTWSYTDWDDSIYNSPVLEVW